MLPRRSVWAGTLLVSAVCFAASLVPASFADDAPPPADAGSTPAPMAPATPAPATPAPADAGATPAPAPADAGTTPTPAPADAGAAPAADATTAPAPEAGAPVIDQSPAAKLRRLADDFLHYALVYNQDMVKDTGQAILATNSDPKDLLAAFEAVSKERDVDATLRRLQRQDSLKDVAVKIAASLEEGHRLVARDSARIQAEIDRLGDGPRAYDNAKGRLTDAGEYAVPYYIQALNDTKKTDLHPYVLQAMIEIGKPVLSPLLEQLNNTPDGAEELGLVDVIGRIGYAEALPYLKAISEGAGTNADLKNAADRAINLVDRRNIGGSITAAEAFVQLARGFYEKQPSVSAPFPKEPANPVWYYNRGLNNVDPVRVPTPIWGDIMAMRACEQALKLQPNNQQAISLWIASNLRREIQLPQGAADPTHKDTDPTAAYYAKAAGPLYLNPVLTMALDDRDGALALKALDALEDTSGTAMMVDAAEGGAPLVRALSYPDRAVRFSAADALARANPAKNFPGSFRVVPVLAEAVTQNGKPSVLIIDPKEGNRIAETFRDKLDYTVYSGNSVNEALGAAHKAASFDLIIISDGAEVAHLTDIGQTDYRLAFTPVLVLTDAASVGLTSRRYLEDSRITVASEDIDDAGLKAVADDSKNKLGGAPLDPAAATTYATTALKLLGTIAGDHASIYSAEDAGIVLRDALKDKRPEIVTGAAAVLGQLSNPDDQRALATAALQSDTDPAVRQAIFVGLAESAKRIGNDLDSPTVDKIITEVSTETDANVRQAASQALGALNLVTNQASALILKQAK